MLFGVSNGCATFQRAIEIVPSGLTYETCLCYFNDRIIPSKNLAQQCERLSLVLGRFREYSLLVKASKCSFGANKGAYLGHVVSSKGVYTDPGKIQTISKLLPPKTVEQVRSFLGLTDYYKKFIPYYASLPAPLVALIKKGTQFTLGDSVRCRIVFVKLPFQHIPNLINLLLYILTPRISGLVLCYPSLIPIVTRV